MPGTVSDGPSVSLSFANNFWGKDDAGVDPLLQRMHNAKITCDELKSFYQARSSIEDDYARKLLSLSRKPLGSQESGTLRASLDVLRGEVEAMGKSHQSIAGQMKTELEEPLAAFAGAMKERRKIVQNGTEKLLKVKIQQTNQVNKTRDKYEQECLKIKGYLAQGHMVMGQEERKNKAKLEKTQINLATSNTEYEGAVKVLEETTGRWNRDWKSAADKFQDLEEERLDFMKSSLWSFANIASTVCVSDDASCEKVRLSLENCEVEKDIVSFIKERGTGQEIPDPPKYINFCRGDVDTQSEASEDDTYSVAQFQRTINPAYRSSSPQPSTYESHHDPKSILARDFAHEAGIPESREATITPQKAIPDRSRQQQLDYQAAPGRQQYDQNQHGQLAAVPHDPYPMDGMTMLCRTGPPSERSSALSGGRPSSRDSQSECSNPTSFSSQEPPSGKASPVKQVGPPAEKQVLKKKSGFFQGHSPFRRKSTKEKDHARTVAAPSNRNTWSASRTTTDQNNQPRRSQYGQNPQNMISDRARNSPEPADPRTNFQLNVGNNVFDVQTSDRKGKSRQKDSSQPDEEMDPIAQALAELKGATKASSSRVSADNYHGISTPAPGATPNSRSGGAQMANGALIAGIRGTPPPSYDQPVSRLGLPQPAFTSKAMQQTRQKYEDQTRDMFKAPQARPDSQGGYGSGSQSRPGTRGNDMPRATSPAPLRSVSPRPDMQVDTRQGYRSASPNPYGGSQRARPQSSAPQKRGSDQGYYRHNSPNEIARAVSPAPFRDQERPNSSHMSNDMSVQLAPADDGYGSQGRGSGRSGGSSSSRTMSYYGSNGSQQGSASRQRSKSVADVRQFNREGRPILHFARAMYMYQAAIPEELSFAKGDVLAVLRHQDDGWWEAEVAGKNGRPGADVAVGEPNVWDVILGARGSSTSSSSNNQHQQHQEFEAQQPPLLACGGNCNAAKAKMDLILHPFRVATSKPAQKTYLNTLLFLIASTILLVLATGAYTAFYYSYVPQIGTERVIHLQYGDGPHPYGIASLNSELISKQAYDISITLHAPRSPPNVETGNFMLSLNLLSQSYRPSHQKLSPPLSIPPETILHSSRRPTILPYTSPFISLSSRILGLPLYILNLWHESESLTIPMAEQLSFPGRGAKLVPEYAVLEVQAGQHIQIYSAKINFTARFSGLRWLMYNHRIISLVLFTSAFWIVEVVFALLGWVGIRMLFPPPPSSKHIGLVKKEGKEDTETDTIKTEPATEDEPDLSDTPHSFPTHSRRAPLRYDTRIKDEDDDSRNSDPGDIETTSIPPPEDADDEAELILGGPRGREGSRADEATGFGTSFSEGSGGRDGATRRRSGGGGGRAGD